MPPSAQRQGSGSQEIIPDWETDYQPGLNELDRELGSDFARYGSCPIVDPEICLPGQTHVYYYLLDCFI